MEIVPRFFLYGEADRDVELRFIHVETIAARSRVHDWHIGPHRHSSLYQVLYLTGGGGELRMDLTTRPLRAPMLVTVPPGVIHSFDFLPGTEGWVITLADGYAVELLRGEGIAEWMNGLTEPSALALDAATANVHGLEARFRDIEQEFLWSALGRAAAVSAHLQLLFIAIARLRHEHAQGGAPTSADAALYARFRALVEARFREHRPLSDYARTLAVTEKRLSAACREAVERTPLEVISERLAIEAKRCLLYTNMTVSQVAYALGFGDPAYFSRFFARHVGVAPSAFADTRSGMSEKSIVRGDA